MFKKGLTLSVMVILIVSLILPVNAQVQERQVVKLWQALKPLETTVSFMNTGAHPDDERSDLLAYLSRGLGVRTASVITNRGEGGQNEIGNELGNTLGIIRSRELIEASKVTGVDLYMLSQEPDDDIYDFGFSKSPVETLDKWGEEVTYERLIQLIRMYKPDIVYPSFRDVDTQHGHHRAINQLTIKAFEDAADPQVFPKQLEEGLTTWQIKKLYLPAENKEQTTTSVEVGGFDPILGVTYPQLGEESRYLHKSQGMGREVSPGSRKVNLELFKSTVKNEQINEDSLFGGVAFDFAEMAEQLTDTENSLRGDLIQLQKNLEALVQKYPDRSAILGGAHDVLQQVNKVKNKVINSKLNQDMKQELLFKLTVKEDQLAYVSEVASSIVVETKVSNPALVNNGVTDVNVRVYNGGTVELKNVKIALNLPYGWEITGTSSSQDLKHQEVVETTFHVKVPADAPYFEPYEANLIKATVSYDVNKVKVSRNFLPVGTVAVLPKVGITFTQEQLVVNTANVLKEIPLIFSLQNYTTGELTTDVSLEVPSGWSVMPEKQAVSFTRQGEVKALEFIVKPTNQIEEGTFNIGAIASVDGQQLRSTVQTIHYDHIGTTYYIYPAEVKGTAFNLQIPEGLKVGYIESGFDQVADELRNVGMDITKLSSNDLKFGDLSQYDTIVIGIRAYLSREDVRESNQRILDYVKNGGHLIVQYHKPWDQWNPEGTPPYNLVLGQPSIKWRVTDEDSEVNMLQPEHPLFQWPNTITDQDWRNWVQDRALYFPMEWDEQYETFVSMADPDEEPFDGGILMAKYGEGTYLYTNLVWYRQIQSQVPGGYRIFTNLISYPLQE